jgi:CRP-like cAMP-binding protein
MEIQNKMYRSVLANISKHISLTVSEQEFFISLLKPCSVSRKEFLFEAGDLCTTFNYVLDGALRAFFTTDDEKEATIMFAVADWWVTDMPCFVSRKPAMISIEAIEDSNILQLSYDDLELLYDKMPKFERYMRMLMQNAYVREQLRVLQNLALPAEERYANFVKKYPAVAMQVTNKHIASYLGITPEFLSVIRARRKS